MEVELSVSDRGRVADLARTLGDLRIPLRSGQVMEQVTDLIGADWSAAWSFAANEGQMCLVDAAASAALPRRFFSDLDQGVRDGELGFLYSPRAPQRAQRDRVLTLPSARAALELHDHSVRRLGHTRTAYRALRPGLERTIEMLDRHGLAELASLRVLICDGPNLLAYLSAARAGGFTPRQQRLFEATAVALRRRTIVDHQLGSSGRLRRSFEAALELLGRVAFLVDGAGRVLHANKLGEHALDHDADLRSGLSEIVRGQHEAHYDVLRLEESSGTHFLVVRKGQQVSHVIASLPAAHELGERARQVLALAISGETTKGIAARLELAENTVEYHLTRLYRCYGVRSRLELQRVVMERIIGGSTERQ